jgi:hypothetical protein
LSKWILNEDGIWQQVLKKKYLKGRMLSQVEKKNGDSHFWADLMEVKDLVLQRGGLEFKMAPRLDSGRIGGKGKDPLMVKYPNLYNIVRKKNVSVAQVLSTTY